jgi:hypothetical protein
MNNKIRNNLLNGRTAHGKGLLSKTYKELYNNKKTQIIQLKMNK